MMGTNRLVKNDFSAIGVIFFISLIFSTASFAEDFSATLLKNYDDVSVISAQGSYDTPLLDGPDNAYPRQEIAKEFFKTHPDNYDFLVIFTNFDFQMPQYEVAGEQVTAAGFYTSIINNVQGIGIDQFDASSLYGSDGKLQGIIDMGYLDKKASDPLESDFSTTMTILSHEIFHRWAVYVHFMKDGTESNALIGSSDSHWSFLFDTSGSVQYGNKWQINNDGTFTTLKGRKYYSQLDLYLMGLIPANEVQPMLLIDNPGVDPDRFPETGVTISGTPQYVSIEDIVAAEGERVPNYQSSQKSFKVGCILLTRPGTLLESEVASLRTIMNHWVLWFSSLTDGKASIVSDTAPIAYIPQNPGVEDPALEPRDVPPEINDAVTWLMDNQSTNGSWVDSPQTSERETAEAILALKHFSVANPNCTMGLQWLFDTPSVNTDFLSRKIQAICGSGQDASSYIEKLLERQNPDGGWGMNHFYMSNPIDTSLVLKTLVECGQIDSSVVDPAINYLKTKQNTDGGWGGEDNESKIQTTVNVLMAFGQFKEQYALDEQIENGILFLLGKQNPDGGFGNSPSTIYDTASATLGLKTFGVYTEDMKRGLDFIQSKQSQNGSWYNSPYQTALALNVIYKSMQEPDLSVSASDITISPATVSSLPTDVTISAVVYNKGISDALQVKVSLYDGAITEEKKMGEMVRDFPGNTSVQDISFNVTITDGEPHYFYIVVDSDEAIVESSELNNKALKMFGPESTYDFSVNDISASPATFNLYQPTIIQSRIYNTGTRDAYNVDVRYFIDFPGQPYDIGTVKVDIPAGGAVDGQITWIPDKNDVVGENVSLTVLIDPNGSFTESTTINNQAFTTMTINSVSGPNLSIAQEDISITPSPANMGEATQINALIKNTGDVAAENIEIGFYVNDPDSEEPTLLGNQTIPALSAGESLTASYTWSDILISGDKVIIVKIDNEDSISETYESDNEAFQSLNILSLPDFSLAGESFTITPAAPKEGDVVVLQISAQNKGGQSASPIISAYENGSVIWTESIQDFTGNSQYNVSFEYNTVGKSGVHTITLKIDPDNVIHESDDSNNSAVRSFGVQDSNLWLSETTISPNGDGSKDVTQFSFVSA